jgi:hypothetical protein
MVTRPGQQLHGKLRGSSHVFSDIKFDANLRCFVCAHTRLLFVFTRKMLGVPFILVLRIGLLRFLVYHDVDILQTGDSFQQTFLISWTRGKFFM